MMIFSLLLLFFYYYLLLLLLTIHDTVVVLTTINYTTSPNINCLILENDKPGKSASDLCKYLDFMKYYTLNRIILDIWNIKTKN